LLSAVTERRPCAGDGKLVDGRGHPLPCLSGAKGQFPKFTSLPEQFKNHGFLSMGIGKLFHDGGYGFGGAPEDTDHPAGPGTPPLADPLSWSNTSSQYPDDCTWTAPDAEACPPDSKRRGLPLGNSNCEWMVACPGLPTFQNSYPPLSLTGGGGAYLTPAGQGSCTGVPPGPFPFPERGGCTEDIPDDGEGPDADGGIHGRPPMLDQPVWKNAIQKLTFAAKNLNDTGQNFFLNVGIKRPHLVWRVPQGIIDEHYHPDRFTPVLAPDESVILLHLMYLY
jgi:hypothetical protein